MDSKCLRSRARLVFLVLAGLALQVSACSSTKSDGPSEIGAQLFAVTTNAPVSTDSLLGVWEGHSSDDLVAADDRVELRADGVTIARRCKNAKSTWFAGARTAATVTARSIDVPARTSAGTASSEGVPCTVSLDALNLQVGQTPKCDGAGPSSAADCFTLLAGSLSIYTARNGTAITFSKIAD